MRTAILVAALFIVPATLAAQARPAPAPPGFDGPFIPRPLGDGPVKVGPARGTVIVVGGGSMGPEIYKAFIDAAGGPDALIIDVPNAGGADTVSANAGQAWRTNGAKNVVVLFTRDRKIADSDSFTAVIRKAGGVWFEGGRQFHIVQDYGGTKTERAIMEVLERGGVVGGSSAGASILGDFMVRGAPSNDNMIMEYPGYAKAFGYLRNVGIDQHVVARSRLPDLADSIIPRHPGMLAISEDEGTAWVIRGDTGRIIGRNKAFVYNGADANDPGSPFLTLHPGDSYDLNARRRISLAIDRSPVTLAVIDSMFAAYADPAAGGATVLVAQGGEVFIDHAFGIPPQPRYMPRTTLPQFRLGNISRVFTELCASMPAQTGRGRGPPDSTAARAEPPVEAPPAGARRGGRGGPPPSPLQACVTRISTPIGAHQTAAADSQQVQSSVDELYRLSLGLDVPTTWRGADYTTGWIADTYKGASRLAAYATADGKRAAFVRLPDRRVTVIILTNDANADARGMAERILDRLLAVATILPRHGSSQDLDPARLVGRWSGSGSFFNAELQKKIGTLPVVTEFTADRSGTGRIGDATLTDVRIRPARERIEIRAKLSGSVGADRALAKDHVILVITALSDSTLEGEFHLKSNSVYDPRMREGRLVLRRAP
jgi:cyanophycinase